MVGVHDINLLKISGRYLVWFRNWAGCHGHGCPLYTCGTYSATRPPTSGLKRWNSNYNRTCTLVFLLLAKYRHMANFFFKNANFGDFFSKTHFLIAKIFIQYDHFSSIVANFHQIMMIPSKIWTKVLHFLFHWCHTFNKWKFTE
jgi:hypothetical protein